jgi:allophanate hydrolase subunit 1
VKTNDSWCLGQTVRQMDTDQVVDLVQGQNATIAELRDEVDQQRIRAELAEAELDAYKRAERRAS